MPRETNQELKAAGFRPNRRCYGCGAGIGEGSMFCSGHDTSFAKMLLDNPASQPMMVEAIQAHLATLR